ncbi:MAG TPA: sigma factor-like helix-turn-helix DNA-binding protein, partial [Gaiellales bacterium]|nr:sigma factor-like helix-turn-helix DNA-binding protein [Gaiellales bacterium]
LRMALLLRDVLGLSYAEIATALETSLATVKWRIYKAREGVVADLSDAAYDFGHAGGRRAAVTPAAV